MEVFEQLESNVRGYCRSFPKVFNSAVGSHITDTENKKYLDFFSGAGTLNYGHNDPDMVQACVEYLTGNGILHSLDMYSVTKQQFLIEFKNTILAPRGLNHKIQFTGPTGTNCIEAAIKLARKVTGRHAIACFTGGYHGMSLGALAITANSVKKQSMGVQVPGVIRLPYDGVHISDVPAQLQMLEDMFCRPGYGNDLPAAFILETIQGEGGINCASDDWLQGVSALAKKLDALLIIDDIQAGNGRSGSFFSFESSGITPDIICMSKSLSGIGFPFAITLLRPEIDVWEPSEHNGTFRGNNLAMLTARVTIEKFWRDKQLSSAVQIKSSQLRQQLNEGLIGISSKFEMRGRGLMLGVAFSDLTFAKKLSARLFSDHMIVETCGPSSEVLKCMPALTISSADLYDGGERIIKAAHAL
ncbi:diaminobutyrate--2-oxoglutarate transaminase [Pseudomonas tremae]|uniref:diaminobutyrate--2-oxoglutarate transaminase n=1 Tax=Pseudomonas tremae TaxID=200454 RepID=UPI001F3F796B|nr:diaminobutyrate--2-oxoglutarate transaminase [Pseudomonas tremae]MCF5714917.1 diaminobutyrate--2-oxoglutarate transaminase family protein [Pseudomonas tremae]UQB31806.1 diaminobutyrate--2-oxoglutarate transaminase [Pseudomonas tremae]